MIVRTIHHFSCSGGSLISKCISCMDNVFLLSELHPNSFSKLTFNPFDPIHQLLVKEKNFWTLEKKIDEFTKRIKQAIDILAQNNFSPVLRDHTHSDYLAIHKNNVFKRTSLIDCLNDYEVKSICTLRHPLHVYQSLQKNNWNHSLEGFDDFCYRYWTMCCAYEKIPFIKFEDFVLHPKSIMKKICFALDLRFNEDFLSQFHKIEVSGNSGRYSELKKIIVPTARECSEEMKKEAKNSKYYDLICEKFNYNVY